MSKRDRFMEPEEMMAYLDGELPADCAAIAAEHLEDCQECQNLASDLCEVSKVLMTWEVVAPEVTMSPEIAKALETREGKSAAPVVRNPGLPVWQKILSPRVLPWAGGLAAVALLVIGISISSLLKGRISANKSSEASRRRTAAFAETQRQGQEGNEVLGRSVNGNLQTRNGALDQNGKSASESYSWSIASEDKSSGNARVYDYSNSNSLTYDSKGQLTTSTPQPAVVSIAQLQTSQSHLLAGKTGGTTAPAGPMIIHTAQITLSTKDFEKTRAGVEDTLKRHNGYVGEMNVTTPTGGARMLTATLRVPASQLDGTLAELKSLGRVEAESQGGEEVTQRYVDLEARLANARNSEVRLTQILQRAGKLSDVLAVEEQIETVRGEIEEMQAEKKTLSNQIDFATLTATVTEVYKEQLQVVPNATSTRFRNAAVEGYRTMVDGIVSLLLFLISVAPTLLLWTAILFFPVRWAWRKLRKKIAQQEAEAHS